MLLHFSGFWKVLHLAEPISVSAIKASTALSILAIASELHLTMPPCCGHGKVLTSSIPKPSQRSLLWQG